jgi:uncharacterized protein (TIGR02145 family)
MKNHPERYDKEISYKIKKTDTIRLRRYTVIVFMIFYISNIVTAQTSGSFIDKRDGKSYKWVKIGNQTWMAENLAYKPESGDCYIFEKEDSKFVRYGYLYSWETAKNVCPSGWHLPDSDGFEELAAFVGLKPGVKLKAKTGWLEEDSNGTDEYYFSALPGGQLTSRKELQSLGYKGFWWSTTKAEPSAQGKPLAMLFYISCCLDSVDIRFSQNINVGASVRCIKDK